MSVCRGCCKEIASSDIFAVCNAGCAGQFHAYCGNLSAAALELLASSENIRWICDVCRECTDFTSNSNCVSVQQKCTQRQAKSACAVILLLAALTSGYVLLRKCSPINSALPAEIVPTNGTANYTEDGNSLRLITRLGWLAEPPKWPLTPLDLPVTWVIVTAVGYEYCFSYHHCRRLMLFEQYHFQASWKQPDIAFNFLIDGDGYVYEGRGWDYKSAQPKEQYLNIIDDVDDAVTIAFADNYKSKLLDAEQVNGFKALVAQGLQLGKLSEDFKLRTTTEFRPINQYRIVETFQNWTRWREE